MWNGDFFTATDCFEKAISCYVFTKQQMLLLV